jgi:dTDP-4-amino-4,6-dideoxygalactose transaminase
MPEIAAALDSAGVQTCGMFYPLHLQPGLKGYIDPVHLPVSERLPCDGMCLPMRQVSPDDVDYICATIRGVVERLA